MDSKELGSISSLLEAAPSEEQGETRIPLAEIAPDPNQPRKEFDEALLQELADSIAEHGVLQPITVGPRNDDGMYPLKYGERRWRASGMVPGLYDIPAFIRDSDDDSYGQMIENIQREDLSPMEIGNWCLRRIEEGAKAGDVAKQLGKPASFVSLHAKLPKLPPFIMALYVEGVVRSPRSLADLERAAKLDQDATAKFCSKISAKGGATAREIEVFLAELKKAKALDKAGAESGEDDGSAAEPKDKEPKSKEPPAPIALDVIVTLGTQSEKEGVLILDKKPSDKSQAYVLFDGNSEALIDLDQLHIVGLRKST